jgi:hypothetical protein
VKDVIQNSKMLALFPLFSSLSLFDLTSQIIKIFEIMEYENGKK